VLLIHCDDEAASGGFVIDQPLRNDKGMLVTNLTRVALAPHDLLNQWIQIEAEPGRKPPFRVTVRDVPKQMPMPTAQPVLPREEPAASMPAAPAPRPASDLPPLLQSPGEPQPDRQPRIPADQGGGAYGPPLSAPPTPLTPPTAPRAPGAASGLSVPGGVPASSVQSRP